MARPLHLVLVDHQCEIIGYANGGFYFEQGTRFRHVAHEAVDSSRAIKRDHPDFQGALALSLSVFGHEKKAPAFKPGHQEVHMYRQIS
jgi:hypothetical protein